MMREGAAREQWIRCAITGCIAVAITGCVAVAITGCIAITSVHIE